MQLMFDTDTPVNLVQKMSLIQASPVSENLLTDPPIETPTESSNKRLSDNVPEKHKTDVEGAIKVIVETEKVINGVLDETELPTDDTKIGNIENDLQGNKSDLMDLAVEEKLESLIEVNKPYMKAQNNETVIETDIDHETVTTKYGGFEDYAINAGNEAVPNNCSKIQKIDTKIKPIEEEQCEITDLNISFNGNDVIRENNADGNYTKAEHRSKEESPDKCDTESLNEDILQEDSSDDDEKKEEDSSKECFSKDLNEDDLLCEDQSGGIDKEEKNGFKSVTDRTKNLKVEEQALESMQQQTTNKNNIGYNEVENFDKKKYIEVDSSTTDHVSADDETIEDNNHYPSSTGGVSDDGEYTNEINPTTSTSTNNVNCNIIAEQSTTTAGDVSDNDPNSCTTTGDISADDESMLEIDLPSISCNEVRSNDKTIPNRLHTTAGGVSDNDPKASTTTSDINTDEESSDNYPKASTTTGEVIDNDPKPPTTTTCNVSADEESMDDIDPSESISTSDVSGIDKTITDRSTTLTGGVSGDKYPKASTTHSEYSDNYPNPSNTDGEVRANDETNVEKYPNKCNITGIVIADNEIRMKNDRNIENICENKKQESVSPAKGTETNINCEFLSHITEDVKVDEEVKLQNQSSAASEDSLEDFIKNTIVNENSGLEKINLCISKETSKPVSELMDVSNTSVEDNADNANAINKSIDIPNKGVEKSHEISKITKKVTSLANNLEIFSDEDDEDPSEKPTIEDKLSAKQNKDCVSLVDDDDDIMVIDDDTSSKTDKTDYMCTQIKEIENTAEANKLPACENKSTLLKDESISTSALEEASVEESDKKSSNDGEVENNPESTEMTVDRPLVATDFLTNFKTKMSEMTRTDLEEFCLLKIVEGVIDRSNLSEIKAKLKTMMQNVDEWRKKTMVLNKQNRDLQIVLRTIQEEQRKRTDEVITPLKITRSVGMQVLMGDGKMEILQRTRNPKRALTSNAPPLKTAQNKTQGRIQKAPIPVPRLVPASPTKPVNVKGSPQLQNSTVTSNSGSGKASTPNGVKAFTPVKVAEKRSYSDSIDLTDDEPAPPAKKPPVRLVPSQQLMAPGRASFVNNNAKNSTPRHVYIPIGSQNIVRPGQTMLVKNGGQGVRTRGPGPASMVRGATPGTRPNIVRGQNKHPAPLPQAYSQPQPPNWKALPPAPDLKISKIENGIVVSWKIDGYQESSYEEIVSYQLYAYQETSQPASTLLWNKIGDIKALPLPMACTLTQFIAGYKYYFAVRAVDKRSRIGPFSLPGSILLLNK